MNDYFDTVVEPLREAGIEFKIEHGGKHPRVVWDGGCHTFPSTPSDARGALNARSDIRRALRDGGLIRSRDLEPVVIAGAEPMADSRDVAAWFEKRHADVLRATRQLVERVGNDPRCKFAPFVVNDLTGQATSHYLLNRNAFSLLVMGFTGAKAIEWKLAYLSAFDRMEVFIREGATAIMWEMKARMDDLEMENARLRLDFEALADLRLDTPKPVVIKRAPFVRPSKLRRAA